MTETRSQLLPLLLTILLICLFFLIQIYPEPSQDVSVSAFVQKRVNVNTASQEELMRLKHIGVKRAEKILVLRNEKRITAARLERSLGRAVFAKISSKIIF